jgi:hypothetical protein
MRENALVEDTNDPPAMPQKEPISASDPLGGFAAMTPDHCQVSPNQLSVSDLAILFQGILGAQDES